MFKDLLKTILLFIVAFLGGNFIALCQKITSNMTEYLFIVSLAGMLIFLWVYIIQTIKRGF